MRVRYNISRLYDAGSKYIIFLSHSNKNDEWKKLKAQLEANDICIASDNGIVPGTPDFAIKIKEMIRDNEVTVVYVQNGQITPWMVYEIGIAAGYNKKIIMFSDVDIDETSNHLFGQYGPVINDVQKLVREIKNSFFFADLFEHETAELSKSMFVNDCVSNIDICRLTFGVPGIEEIPKNMYKFGYILLAVSRYEKMENPERVKNICNMTAEEIKDCICNIDGKPCSLCSRQSYDSPTDVILNKILFNCAIDTTKQTVCITLPFNKNRGVTFKCFVDVNNMDYVQEIMSLLEKAGFYDIGVSHSVLGNRVYFMLPQSAISGLFTVEAPDGFVNNYLCKGAVL